MKAIVAVVVGLLSCACVDGYQCGEGTTVKGNDCVAIDSLGDGDADSDSDSDADVYPSPCREGNFTAEDIEPNDVPEQASDACTVGVPSGTEDPWQTDDAFMGGSGTIGGPDQTDYFVFRTPGTPEGVLAGVWLQEGVCSDDQYDGPRFVVRIMQVDDGGGLDDVASSGAAASEISLHLDLDPSTIYLVEIEPDPATVSDPVPYHIGWTNC